METTRLILVLSLTVVGMLLWQAWEQDYGRGATESGPVPSADSPLPAPAGPAAPEAPPPGPAANAAPMPGAAPAAENAVARVTIETDVLRLEIGSRGAGIRRAELLRYPVSLEHRDEPFVLLNDSGPDFYVTQGGLLSHQPAPTDTAEFQSSAETHTLAPGSDDLEVPFTWSDAGITVRKIYELRRGSYAIGVRYVPKLFARNERVAIHQRSDAHGRVTSVMVGAIGVGRIGIAFDDSVVTNDGRKPGLHVYGDDPPRLERGDELGVFHLGSTVVLFLPPGGGHRWIEPAGAAVRMGQALARKERR